MARIRTTKPDFFLHEGLQDLGIAHPGKYWTDRRAYEENRVSAVIEWSNTGRVGRQMTFFADYGLCG